jgi:hypothetical protein
MIKAAERTVKWRERIQNLAKVLTTVGACNMVRAFSRPSILNRRASRPRFDVLAHYSIASTLFFAMD